MRTTGMLPLAAVLLLAACSESPVGVAPEADVGGTLVITEGIKAPPVRWAPMIGYSTLENASPLLDGSSTAPVSLAGEGCTDPSFQDVQISYTVSGGQQSAASFKVNTTWSYNDGTGFVGSDPVTVTVPARSGAPEQFQVPITVENTTEAGSGTTTFVVAPFDLVTNQSDPPGQRLSIADPSSSATIHVEFHACTSPNTPPSLTLPADITAEAEGPLGAAVTFVVSAADAEDGDLTSAVVCTPASGSTFALGETTVNCSVTDTDGATTNGSFKVNVVDTTPPDIAGIPTDDPVVLIAEDIDGATYDASGITASDLVDGSVAVTCGPLDFALGQSGTVTCSATDNAGNTATAQFNVLVTLDFSGVDGFFTPLRMAAPFSAHKLGSTVPHKFGAPEYADGSLATDLAAGLRLVLVHEDGTDTMGDDETQADLSAGSTAWRWDPDAQQYVFNLKSGKTWKSGGWTTAVDYAGLEIASTQLVFRK